MTSPKGHSNWFARRNTNSKSNNYNISDEYTNPQTSDSPLRISIPQQDFAAEQPHRQWHFSPVVKSFFSGAAAAGRNKSRTNRLHVTPSPEQGATSPSGKSPLLHPFSWTPRTTKGFVGGASPSQSEIRTILELGDLIKCQTANPVHTLQRLDGLESLLKTNGLHRGNLLGTAKFAVQIAYGDFDRARSAARQRMIGKEPAPMIHLADIRDLRTFVDTSLLLTKELENSMSNSGALQHLILHYRYAAEGLKVIVKSLTRGGADAEMMEIRWTVERKCMYWDAVAMMDARIGEAGRVDEVSQRPRRHSG